MKKFMVWIIAIMVLFSMGCESYGGETLKEAYERGYQEDKRTGNPLRVKSKMVSLLCLKPLMRLSHEGYQEGYSSGYKAGIL